jgi:hypothetical protein
VNRLKIAVLAVATTLALAGASTTAQTPSNAEMVEEQMRQVRKQIKEKRDSALRTLLSLSPEQAQAFRPLQQAYDEELQAQGKKDLDLIREFSAAYDELDAAAAAELGKRFFELEREHLALQEKYLKKISDEVSPVVAVQFLQLQRQFEAELELERMKYMPLAE